MSDDDIPWVSSTEILSLIGDYGLVRILGTGGAGQVLECLDEKLDRKVAIKVLPKDADPEKLKRFEREGRALAKIDSPYVVGVHKVGVHAGSPYLVLQLAEGPDLETELRDNGPLDVERSVELARQVALGLETAHKAGILHRDIKPANLLQHAGGVKVTDFGLATPIDGSDRLTQAGLLNGTAAFMAPERIKGQVDARADVYALGATLYTLLAGKPPLQRDTPIETISAHIHEAAEALASVRPEVPSSLSNLVAQMMAKDPADRPQTAEAVADALASLGEAEAPDEAPAADVVEAPVVQTLVEEGVRIVEAELVPLVQQLEHARATAIIEFPFDEARVGLVNGAVVFAEAGDLTGQAAFRAAVEMKLRKHRVRDGARPDVENIDIATSALILDVRDSAPPALESPPTRGPPIADRALVLARRAGQGVAPVVGQARTWLGASRRNLAIAVGGLAFVVIVGIAIASSGGGGEASGAGGSDVLARIDRGEARAVLAEFDEIPSVERDGVDELGRAHALVALKDADGALAAFRAAADKGAQDARGLRWTLVGLAERETDARIQLLVEWPGDQIVPLLVEQTKSPEWWPRHHAWRVLEKRGDDGAVDVTALAIQDLQTGPTCNKKRFGLTLLKERGAGPAALDALGRVRTDGWNPCISSYDVEDARAAVRRR